MTQFIFDTYVISLLDDRFWVRHFLSLLRSAKFGLHWKRFTPPPPVCIYNRQFRWSFRPNCLPPPNRLRSHKDGGQGNAKVRKKTKWGKVTFRRDGADDYYLFSHTTNKSCGATVQKRNKRNENIWRNSHLTLRASVNGEDLLIRWFARVSIIINFVIWQAEISRAEPKVPPKTFLSFGTLDDIMQMSMWWNCSAITCEKLVMPANKFYDLSRWNLRYYLDSRLRYLRSLYWLIDFLIPYEIRLTSSRHIQLKVKRPIRCTFKSIYNLMKELQSNKKRMKNVTWKGHFRIVIYVINSHDGCCDYEFF